MRVFAVSDVHVDYSPNLQWVEQLSTSDYQHDVLILAGDVSDSLPLLIRCFQALTRRFKKVLFTPGNHELWVLRDRPGMTSLEKLQAVRCAAVACGVSLQPYRCDGVAVVPLASWYDYSFGLPGEELQQIWMDFRACRWPDDVDAHQLTLSFLAGNDLRRMPEDKTIISFSHFLPRIDLVPVYVPESVRRLFPVFGTERLDLQIRELGSSVHVYGHSHLNRSVHLGGVRYVNSALGYPHETRITTRSMACVL